ncbi:MAG: hypothetical protein ABIL69_04365 [candidate division WOR-3 bacterium]
MNYKDHLTLGNRLIALFIDDGLMRENEPEQVTAILKKLGIKTVVINAANIFLRH